MKALARSRGDGWEHPTQVGQGELFGRPRDDVLALAGVSLEDMENWRVLGWISYDVRRLDALDESQVSELAFVRNIARSGLTRIQVDMFLEGLAKPYCYDPSRVAYSFAHGWVQRPDLPATVELHAYMRDNIDAWITALEDSRNRAMLDRLGTSVIKATLRLNEADDRKDNEDK